jgi:adenylate cyclase
VRYNVACFYAQVGEVEKALDFLDGTITSRSWVENDPELEPLRSHPRYHRILDGLGPAAPSGAGMPPSPA